MVFNFKSTLVAGTTNPSGWDFRACWYMVSLQCFISVNQSNVYSVVIYLWMKKKYAWSVSALHPWACYTIIKLLSSCCMRFHRQWHWQPLTDTITVSMILPVSTCSRCLTWRRYTTVTWQLMTLWALPVSPWAIWSLTSEYFSEVMVLNSERVNVACVWSSWSVHCVWDHHLILNSETNNDEDVTDTQIVQYIVQ